MLEALKRSRALRLLMCAFMVPLIVMTSSNTARAAEALGSNVLRIQTSGGGLSFTDAAPDCTIQVNSHPAGLQVYTGYCEYAGAPDFECELMDPDCTNIRMEYKGTGCSLNQAVTIDRFDDGWFTNRGYIYSGVRSVAGCIVTTACVVIEHDKTAWPNATYTGCADIGLDVVGDAVAECPHGEVSTPVVHPDVKVAAPSGYSNRSVTRTVYIPHTLDPAYGWMVYAIVKRKDEPWAAAGSNPYSAANRGSTPLHDQVMLTRHVLSPPHPVDVSPFEFDIATGSPVAYDYSPGEEEIENFEILGVGVMQWNSGDVLYTKGHVPSTVAQASGRLAGSTDLGNCIFYFGDKVWDDGLPEGPDEPIGPIAHPERDEEDTSLPDDLDVVTGPDTEGGFWAAVVDALGRIIGAISSLASAIGGLVSGIVNGLRGALVDLFVPDEFPDWSSVSVDLPSGWVPELPELGSGACGPVVMPVMDFGMAGEVGGYPFVDTCEAPWTHVRTVTYFGLMALAFVVVAKRVFNAAMGGIGMGVESSGGGDDL